MATEPQRPASAQIDLMIKMTDELIVEVAKIDPIATTLLGLAKAELVTRKAIRDGVVLPFPPKKTPEQ